MRLLRQGRAARRRDIIYLVFGTIVYGAGFGFMLYLWWIGV